MKTFKAICAATILALSLTMSTYAETGPGDGHGPGKTTTATPEESVTIGTAADETDLLSFADIMWVLATIY